MDARMGSVERYPAEIKWLKQVLTRVTEQRDMLKKLGRTPPTSPSKVSPLSGLTGACGQCAGCVARSRCI